MKNKNEVVVKNNTNEKNIGKFLLCTGIGLIILSAIVTILRIIGFDNSVINPVNHGALKTFLNFLYIIILNVVGIALVIGGIVLLIKNNKKVNETIIPKAKETLDKAEPVVTDVIKTVGEGIEDIAHNVKDTIDKNKNNKKGE